MCGIIAPSPKVRRARLHAGSPCAVARFAIGLLDIVPCPALPCPLQELCDGCTTGCDDGGRYKQCWLRQDWNVWTSMKKRSAGANWISGYIAAHVSGRLPGRPPCTQCCPSPMSLCPGASTDTNCLRACSALPHTLRSSCIFSASRSPPSAQRARSARAAPSACARYGR